MAVLTKGASNWARRWGVFTIAAWVGLLGATQARAHPDKVESELLFHFATGTHEFAKGRWEDLTHRLTALANGNPQVTNRGPALAMALDGFSDWFEAAPSVAEAQAKGVLPKRALSAAAWVSLRDTTRVGGIVGLIQDNADFEKGWLLGYNRKTFSLTLSTTGKDDGNGELSRLNGKTAIEPERWYYVVATYDGVTAKLYVNGALEGESTVQNGDILYPETGRLALGAYVDDDELRPMEGDLFEVKVYGRALSQAEIGETARRNAGLIAWRSPVNQNLQFVVRPFLQSTTQDSIVVACETSAAARLWVEYGEQQPLQLRAESVSTALINSVSLRGLKPFTRYFYRVIAQDGKGELARSEIATFQTIPGEDQAWAFGILGDTQRNPDVTRKCAEGLFGLRPNFLLHCGDVVDDGFAKQQWVYDLFEPCANLFAHVPVFPVIGNHEKNAHWYYDYFHLPAPEYYYTFRMGNAQFFMIDSNKDCGPGSEQYRWLERELAASKAAWKFTAHHHPCFSSDEDDYGDHWKGKMEKGRTYTWGDSNVRKLVPLYEKYGVDIAFAGHIHSYERTWPILQMSINPKRGVRYVVSGGGGGGLEQAGPQRSWFTLHVFRGHHYCFASVFDRTIQFKAYDLEGRLFDTFELTKETVNAVRTSSP